MMRTFTSWFIGIIAGLLAAPLIGWSVAVMLSHFGITHCVLESPFGGTLTLSCKEGIPGAPLQVGSGVAVISGIFISYLWVRLNLRWPKGWRISGMTLLFCVGAYTWLLWDEPMPEPIPTGKLQPHPGVICMPREQVLEACKDNSFSKVADWPAGLIELKDAECSSSWALEHEAEIRANWEKLKPVSEWIDRVNRSEAFDDYVDAFATPILAFQPLRQVAWSSRQMAMLAAAKGDFDMAIEHLGRLLTFSHRLQQGSRCLVTLMIGVVTENIVLKTIDSFLSDKRLSAAQRESLARLVGQSSPEWADLERCFLNESMFAEKALRSPCFSVATVEPKWLRALICAAYLKNTTIRAVRREFVSMGREARDKGNEDPAKLTQGIEPEMPVLCFKNYIGILMQNSLISKSRNLSYKFHQNYELRAKVLNELRKPISQ